LHFAIDFAFREPGDPHCAGFPSIRIKPLRARLLRDEVTAD
jgi:hypothetical protein